MPLISVGKNMFWEQTRGRSSSGLWGDGPKEEEKTREHANQSPAELQPAALARQRWVILCLDLAGWQGACGWGGGLGMAQLFMLTDSLMTRWCWVCQQSCRLRMNGCLTCRCQKGTHTHTRTHAKNEWGEMDQQPDVVLQNENVFNSICSYTGTGYTHFSFFIVSTCSATCSQNITSPGQMCHWTSRPLMQKITISFDFGWSL